MMINVSDCAIAVKKKDNSRLKPQASHSWGFEVRQYLHRAGSSDTMVTYMKCTTANHCY